MTTARPTLRLLAWVTRSAAGFETSMQSPCPTIRTVPTWGRRPALAERFDAGDLILEASNADGVRPADARPQHGVLARRDRAVGSILT